MRRALDLALRSPVDDVNPRVGCTLLDPTGRIVAEGWHRGAGTPHAEIDALDRLPAEWRDRAHELTAVVTLEPCNHTGRTGPCAQRLAETGIAAVAYAIADPGPLAGGGSDTLRAAGVEVRGGVLEAEGRALLAPWLARQHGTARSHTPVPEPSQPDRRRPFVTVKWAQTLDGRAAASDGSSRWITGPQARADVHRRRALADAILVGTGTLLADDPALTARAEGGELLVPAAEQPLPVVLGRREIPAEARIRQHPALAARGAAEPLRFDGCDLAGHLAQLSERGIRRLFVEGGPTVASALVAAGLADEVLVYVAPALLGGPKLALGDLGITGMSGILRLEEAEVQHLGDDLLVHAAIARAAGPAAPPGNGAGSGSSTGSGGADSRGAGSREEAQNDG
nr:bifunctional diaminohydroxyphosphoribosylaminopyrimidine deaminase/5-amino-6-(5-phosphoribosylamino)uracil reductase RibD [Leucobacter soli]